MQRQVEFLKGLDDAELARFILSSSSDAPTDEAVAQLTPKLNKNQLTKYITIYNRDRDSVAEATAEDYNESNNIVFRQGLVGGLAVHAKNYWSASRWFDSAAKEWSKAFTGILFTGEVEVDKPYVAKKAREYEAGAAQALREAAADEKELAARRAIATGGNGAPPLTGPLVEPEEPGIVEPETATVGTCPNASLEDFENWDRRSPPPGWAGPPDETIQVTSLCSTACLYAYSFGEASEEVMQTCRVMYGTYNVPEDACPVCDPFR